MSTEGKGHRDAGLVDRVKAILGTRGLSLHQVSQRSVELYGASSPYFLPHNLYRDLEGGSFSPRLYQLCALSRISGYELKSWLRAFGFAVEKIPQLQILLANKRTVLLDSSVEDPRAFIPWFQDASDSLPPATIVPLSVLLAPSDPRLLHSLRTINRCQFLYAKVGSEDGFAFPDLLPGSIVRVNPRISEDALFAERGWRSRRIFLIEHEKGLWCCRLQLIGKDRIVPVSSHIPYGHVELRLSRDVRIIGPVDMEIRRLSILKEPSIPNELSHAWEPKPYRQEDSLLPEMLRQARKKSGLSFREASAMSHRAAEILGDMRHFAAPGTLSDYEARAEPPRHIHKVITLCLLYGISFSAYLMAAGIRSEQLGSDTIPSKLVPDSFHIATDHTLDVPDDLKDNPNLYKLVAQLEEMPFFLGKSLEDLFSMRDISLRDLFWMGSESTALPFHLGRGVLAIVNRHKKNPPRVGGMPWWQQPLHLLMKRDGSFLCVHCSLDGGMLTVRPNDPDGRPLLRLRNRIDAEIVGQVVALIRRVS